MPMDPSPSSVNEAVCGSDATIADGSGKVAFSSDSVASSLQSQPQCFNGLRVRMGISTGVLQDNVEVRESAVMQKCKSEEI